MAIDTTTSRSRRALLTAAAGAVAATAVQAVARPLPAQATIQSAYLINDENDATVISGNSAFQSGFPNSGSGTGVQGASTSGTGVHGFSNSGYGVYGDSYSGTGVYASSYSGYGVSGASTSNYGVSGTSTSSYGVYGESGSSLAVHGTSLSGTGVFGKSRGSSQAATIGWSAANSTGILGFSNDNSASPVAPQAKTGVYGYASQDATAVGVRGESTTGRGGVFKGNLAQLRLSPSSAATHPSSGAKGDLFVDTSGRLWFCKGGTTWKQLA